MKRKCSNCGDKFTIYHSADQTCSPKCRREMFSKRVKRKYGVCLATYYKYKFANKLGVLRRKAKRKERV